jgi:DeoR/GlpR family transcriptional regulator of sugar metabolism
MGPNERRLAIMETLCQRRHETMDNLSFEFGVSIRTIRIDIDHLSLSYPLETVRGRYSGGVRVMDGFHINRKYLNPEQKNLLERFRTSLSGNDRTIMTTILKDFALN